MFKKASKLKLRFATTKGHVTTEDLWDLPLRNLDNLAKDLSKAVKESGEESFIVKRNRVNTILDLKFSIIKQIIKDRLEEAEHKENETANKARKNKILDIIEDKENEGLRDESISNLKKMARKL